MASSPSFGEKVTEAASHHSANGLSFAGVLSKSLPAISACDRPVLVRAHPKKETLHGQ
jgi:hypothetical protein